MQGEQSKEGMFPYMASLMQLRQHLCGVSIIGQFWALSAAHCVYDIETGNIADDKLLSIAVGNIHYRNGMIHQVQLKILHEGFNINEHVNDIMLIKVIPPFVFSKTVQPLKIYPYPIDDYETPVDAIVAGWGLNEESWKRTTPTATPEMRFAEVNTIPLPFCKTVYSMANETFSPSDSHICVFTMVGRGTCTGDSGGPLVTPDGQIGILSVGGSCDNTIPEIYTRISSYYTWIKKALGDFNPVCEHIKSLL
nr:chymotrypsin-1-like [Onthophagus taurus]